MTRKEFQILDRPIAFHRCLVKPCGSVNAALMLSQAIYWSLRTSNPDGWFYKTQEEWEEETGLGRREQETARTLLRERGLMDEQRRTVPAKMFFRVDLDLVQTRLAESAILVCTKAPIKNGGKRQSLSLTETTTETTAAEEEEDTAAAFSAIGFSKAFGHKEFQDVWLSTWAGRTGNQWVTELMEHTIQVCQTHGIKVPPQFYEAKHDVEKRELTSINQKRIPL